MHVTTAWMTSLILVTMVTEKFVKAQFPVYGSVCNHTVNLRSGSHARTLRYTSDPNASQVCWTYINAQSDYHLRFRFSNLVPCTCSEENQCANYVELYLKDNLIPFISYCYQKKTLNNEFVEIAENEMHVKVLLSNVTSVNFDLDVYSVYYGSCSTEEVSCPACISKTLVCNNALVQCDADVTCSTADSTTVTIFEGFKMDIFTLVVIIIAVVFVVAIFVCICISILRDRKRLSSDNTMTSSDNPTQTTFPNCSWTDIEIDYRTCVPPPEYTSTPPPEYSSVIKAAYQKTALSADKDFPPCYNDAIRNLDKYQIYDEISHI